MKQLADEMLIKRKRYFKLSSFVATFAVLPLLLFIYITSEVREKVPLGPDIFLLNEIRNRNTESLSKIFFFFTNVGSAAGIALIVAAVVVILFYIKNTKAAYLVILAIVTSGISNYFLKLLFKRARPDAWPSFVTEYNYSYPSGHAMASSAFTLAVIYIAWKTRYRWPVFVISIVFTFMVSLSRLYFGVHFPSDILAGWLISFISVSILSSLILKFPTNLSRKVKDHEKSNEN